jgi:hypothetical protein
MQMKRKSFCLVIHTCSALSSTGGCALIRVFSKAAAFNLPIKSVEVEKRPLIIQRGAEFFNQQLLISQ